MRKFLTYIMICSFIVSCDSGSGLPEVEETIDESYSFLNIEYYAADSCRDSLFIDMPTITFFNNDNTTRMYPVEPFIYDETSHFVSEDSDAFLVEGMELFVPQYIDVNNKIYLGSRKWKYSRNVQSQKSEVTFSDVKVMPNSVLTMDCRLFLIKYKTDYKLYLKGDLTGHIKIIEGIWTGVCCDNRIQIVFQSPDL